MKKEKYPADTQKIFGPMPVIEIPMGIMTTYDPDSDTFGHATTIIGGPFSPFGFSENWSYSQAKDYIDSAKEKHGIR